MITPQKCGIFPQFIVASFSLHREFMLQSQNGSVGVSYAPLHSAAMLYLSLRRIQKMFDHATPPPRPVSQAYQPRKSRPPSAFMVLFQCVAWSAAAWIITAVVSSLAMVSLDGWRGSGPFELWNFVVMFLITCAMTGGFTMPAFFAFGIPVFWLVRHRKGWSWKAVPGLLVSALSIGSFFVIMPMVETCQNSADARATIAATLSEKDMPSLRGINTGSIGSRFCPDTFAYAREGRQMEGSVQANQMTGPTINEHAVK